MLDHQLGYLGQGIIRAAVVPARAAYLIRAGSRDGFRRAVQEACTRWAGVTEPIVAVRKGGDVDGLWEQLVEVADVDGLVNVDARDSDAKSVAARFGLDVIPLDRIDRSATTRWTSHPVAVAERQRWESSLPIIATEHADLWEVAAAGDLTAEGQATFSEVRLPARRPKTRDAIARAQLSASTLLDLTSTSFGEHATRHGPWPAPALVWISKPNSLTDALGFWNLRALRPVRFEQIPMLLLPHRGVEDWLGLDEQLHGLLARPDEVAPDVLLLSISAADHIDQVAEILGLERTREKVRSSRSSPPPPTRQPPFKFRSDIDPFHWVVFERDYGLSTDVLTQLFETRTVVEFDSPVRFHGPSAYALVRFSGAPFDRLPRRSEVAQLVQANAVWHGNSIQLATGAHSHYRFELSLPTPDDVVHTVVASGTSSYSLSDKGQLGEALLARGPAEHLVEPGAFEAIEILKTPRSRDLLRQIRTMSDAPDGQLLELVATWGGRGRRRYRSAEQVGSDEQWPADVSPASALEALVAAGWAERGSAVDCERCGVPWFVAAPRLDAVGTCPGCGHPQGYTTDDDGLVIFYRLDALVDRCSDQGVLPALMVIQTLTRREDHVHLLPGVTAQLRDGDFGEVDVIGTVGAKVVAGEVKTSPGRLTPAEVKKSVTRSKAFGADVHVIAAVGAIKDDKRALATDLSEAAGMEAWVLDQSELRPNA